MTQPDYWTNHEQRILGVVSLALTMLIADPDLPENEDKLNRKLFFYIHRANRSLVDSQGHLDWPLVYEARNQPDADDEVRAGREDKRPDFIWGIYDHQELDPDKSAKYYTLECKRLGAPPIGNAGYKLNVNYISNGVLRFVLAEWAYAKSCRSGLMIGYVQSMKIGDVLSEVNQSAKGYALPEIKSATRSWNRKGVNRLNHQLERADVLPTPFDLRHLWADLS
jgi:hypothetical protein